MFKIFLKSLTRRADYEKKHAESNDYPHQFCAHRWVGNDLVTK